MWAELKAQNAPNHVGEVGIQYDTKALETNDGKLVFSGLFQDTALHRFTEGEMEQLYGKLQNVFKYANSY
jgi:hypothetical protein